MHAIVRGRAANPPARFLLMKSLESMNKVQFVKAELLVWVFRVADSPAFGGAGVLAFFPEKEDLPALENEERSGTRKFTST